MIFAAVQGASLASKILVGIAVVGTIAGLSFAGGMHWEESNTLKVKAEYDKFVHDTETVGVVRSLEGKITNLKYETLKKDSDHEIALSRNSTLAYADELRKRAKSPRRSLLPTPTPSPGDTKRTDYDRSELTRAMGEFTNEMGALRREATELLNEGARSEAELNGVKRWAQAIEKEPRPE